MGFRIVTIGRCVFLGIFSSFRNEEFFPFVRSIEGFDSLLLLIAEDVGCERRPFFRTRSGESVV